MRAADYAHFVEALCKADLAPPDDIRAPAAASLADRFAIHRNNIHVSLVDSLVEGFALVHAHVGDEFFRAMARAHVQQHKPRSPQLLAHGEDFPAFIAGFAPAASLPWLPDLARLELAWSASWAAADADTLKLAALKDFRAAALAQSSVQMHQAARLLRSEWPVADLWELHRSPAPDLSGIEWQPQSVLLTRPESQVLLQRLDEAAADFTAALFAGKSIADSAALAPQIDAGALLAKLLADGAIQAMRQ